MISDSKNLFWDACIVSRWLTASPNDYVNDIHQFIFEASKGERKIYLSTISFAEIKPSHLKHKNFGSVDDLIKAFKKAFYPIGPTPDIMMQSAQLKDLTFRKQPKDKTEKGRVVGTGDAIQLLTCLHLKLDMGVPDVIFHTLDDGKGSTWEGRCVPLLSFHEWTAGHASNPLVKRVIDLNRAKPNHPWPTMFQAPLDSG